MFGADSVVCDRAGNKESAEPGRKRIDKMRKFDDKRNRYGA